MVDGTGVFETLAHCSTALLLKALLLQALLHCSRLCC
jgi:hypothetical protein